MTGSGPHLSESEPPETTKRLHLSKRRSSVMSSSLKAKINTHPLTSQILPTDCRARSNVVNDYYNVILDTVSV